MRPAEVCGCVSSPSRSSSASSARTVDDETSKPARSTSVFEPTGCAGRDVLLDDPAQDLALPLGQLRAHRLIVGELALSPPRELTVQARSSSPLADILGSSHRDRSHLLEVIWISRSISWLVISLFLRSRSIRSSRGSSARTSAGTRDRGRVPDRRDRRRAVGWTFVPKLVSEVNGFVQHLPNYVHDLTHGRGRLGFLERKYHVVEKVRQAGQERRRFAAARSLRHGASRSRRACSRIVAASVTIVFLTFFMLLEGRGGSSASTPAARAVAAALAEGRARHLPHGRRLRDRQPADQPDRGLSRRRSCCS